MAEDKIIKRFSVSGPVNRPQYYQIDPITRWNLKEVMYLIDGEQYFMLHAPRQTGKTSCLFALEEYLNAKGKYYAVYTNVEPGIANRDDILVATTTMVKTLLKNVKRVVKDKFDSKAANDYVTEYGPAGGISDILFYLSQILDKPLVLMIDEIDALMGDTLISVLRQLREGFPTRPNYFPHSIILCGLRNIKDFRLVVDGKPVIAGYSSFNILTKVLRLGNFTREEVINLYNQHTEATGQRFEEDVFDLVMEYTNGQPWLVSALAEEVTNEMEENLDRSVTLTAEMFKIAKERIILARRSHIEYLMDKLKEERVRRVIEPILLGTDISGTQTDDIDFCVDLGIINKVNNLCSISNKIYEEVIPRELSFDAQVEFTTVFKGGWLAKDGSINMTILLTMFRDFWAENSKIWGKKMAGYKEAAPHLVLQAFLQRVVNGGGEIIRESGAGRGRLDIYIDFPYKKDKKHQQIVIEVKTISKAAHYDRIKQEALQQTASYAKHYHLKKNAYIIIFDRSTDGIWKPNEPIEHEVFKGVKMEIWKFWNEITGDRWQVTDGRDNSSLLIPNS